MEVLEFYHVSNLPMSATPPLLPYAPVGVKTKSHVEKADKATVTEANITKAAFYQTFVSEDFLRMLAVNIITCIVVIGFTVLILRKVSHLYVS